MGNGEVFDCTCKRLKRAGTGRTVQQKCAPKLEQHAASNRHKLSKRQHHPTAGLAHTLGYAHGDGRHATVVQRYVSGDLHETVDGQPCNACCRQQQRQRLHCP